MWKFTHKNFCLTGGVAPRHKPAKAFLLVYIHTSFLKEIIETSDPQAKKERITALSFYYFFKSRYRNSVFYNYHYSNNRKSCFTRYGNELDMDARVVKKYALLLIKWGLAVKRGNHLQLVALDKAFEFKTKKNGKSDRKHQKKFIKVIVGKQWSMREVRSFVRVLLFKVVSNNKLLAEFYKKEEPFCKEDSKALFRLTRKLVPRRGRPGINLMCQFGIKLISKTIGTSKSTAERVIDDMVNARVVFRKRGEYSKVRSAKGLTISQQEYKKRFYGQMFSSDGQKILKKECNAYAI